MYEILNDEGVPVFLSAFSDTFYCSRKMDIPGSDGRCGPDNGPQCKSCAKKILARVTPFQANIAVLEQNVKIAQNEAEYRRKQLLVERQTSKDTETALRNEIVELQKENNLLKKRAREAEAKADAAAGNTLGDDWTREIKEVWPRAYKGLALAFHDDKIGGLAGEDKLKAQAFFKFINAQNEVFTGKGMKSAADRQREEQEAVAREQREKQQKLAEEEERQQKKKASDFKSLMDLLGPYNLAGEEEWLRKLGVHCLEDLKFLTSEDFEGRNGIWKYFLEQYVK